ncbi:FCS-Like Zinc finger 17-like [Rhododendron vialii]|uniref:FCS-Like Zinc finger 17-like n=1 Tax=Rhododendron vialii TaxID=182163 RepID=UPI00265D7517|nr:FCS-Like Zinc finger 17-like [Rhododendron vialii]
MGEEDVPQRSENRFNFKPQRPQQRASVDDVGLRILIEISQGKSNFNIVVKKLTLKLKTKPTFPRNRIHTHHPMSFSHESNSFLKSCFLCTKELSLDRDVYMYKGDQGFCSVECRDRQIYLDEIKEMEESTKKMVANYRQCRRTSDRQESRALLEQFRQRHKPLPGPKDRSIVLFT